MATYRVANISFALIDLSSANCTLDVERLDATWTHIKTLTVSVLTSSTAQELVREIGGVAKEVAIKDNLTNDIFEDVIAILTDKEFET